MPVALPTVAVALGDSAKSPPAADHSDVSKKVWIHVASPVVEGAPPPPPPSATDEPSPQSASKRRKATGWSPTGVRDMFIESVTLSIVAPAGTALATSNAMTARRIGPLATVPANIPVPAPLLKDPVASS